MTETMSWAGEKFELKDCVMLTQKYRRMVGVDYLPKKYAVKDKNGDFIPIDYSSLMITDLVADKIKTEFCVLTDEERRSFIYVSFDNIKRLPCIDQIKEILANNKGLKISGALIENYDLAIKLGLVDDVVSGRMLDKESLEALNQLERDFADYERFDYPKALLKEMGKMDKIKFGIESPTFSKMEGNKYTYGWEIETIRGIIPCYIRKNLNMKGVFDGSLRLSDGKAHGAEYVSGVLKGDAGLIHTHEMVSEISKRCEINKLCSVHVHVGGVDFNQEFIVYMYKLALMIEKEMYSIMPGSRSVSEYCRKIIPLQLEIDNGATHEISIINSFEKIRRIINVSNNPEDYKISKEKDHPLGHCCGYRRDTPRYWWLNFVPAMYNIRGNKSYTIEYRIHSATMSYRKIENWILICLGITSFVENYKRDIVEGITLSDIMKKVYPKNHEYLIKYIEKRKKTFSVKTSSKESDEYASENNKNEKLTKKQLLNVHNSI